MTWKRQEEKGKILQMEQLEKREKVRVGRWKRITRRRGGIP